MQDRIDTLTQLSGLKIIHRHEKGESVYEFHNEGRIIKAAFTYDKAKLFAEGIQFGKSCKKCGE